MSFERAGLARQEELMSAEKRGAATRSEPVGVDFEICGGTMEDMRSLVR